MKIEHIRNILLKCSNIEEAITLMCGDDAELQKHLVVLAVREYNEGLKEGVNLQIP